VVSSRPAVVAELLARLRAGPADAAARSMHELVWQALEALYPEAAARFASSREGSTDA
jgi:hypothetical protein